MTFEQAFLKIKAKFDNADFSKLNRDFAIQVNMTDEDCGGAFYIQSTDGKLFVEPYDYRDNTADVTLTRQDLNKILDKKLSASKALEGGKLYINGNAEDFTAAVDCLPAPEKKTVVKKPAKTKKTTAKKAENKSQADKKAETKSTADKKATVKKAESKPQTEKKAELKKTEAKKTVKSKKQA